MSLAIRGAAVGILSILLLSAVPAAGQPSCPQPGDVAVRLDFRQPKPVLERIRIAELRQMSSQELSEHEQALGLYKTELRTALRIQFAMTSNGDMACIGTREVTIEAEYADRRIYVAQELQASSCQYDVTLAHEQHHAGIDDTVLGRELPKLKQTITRIAEDIGSVGPIRTRDVEAYRAEIGDRLQRVFEREIDRIGQIRRREQSQIDTPESYRRESERCPGGLAVK